MRPFTLVMPFYMNAQMLVEQVRCWTDLPSEVARHLHVVVVDDGSPTASAREALRSIDLPRLASFQLWAMLVDIRWNQDACRNLGVKHSTTDWLLMTDMDHVVPAATWLRLMTGKLNKRAAYRFGRVTAPCNEPYKRHPNSWALTRQTYWECGGYDERLAGNYGTDGDFFSRVKGRRRIIDLPEVLVRVPREVVPDASTTTLTRKAPEDKDNIRRIMATRANDILWKPLHFSFPHKRVI